jgi:pimeloyl-ACP methyl ester carboxylesterase
VKKKLVLVPGYGSTKELWKDQIDVLSDICEISVFIADQDRLEKDIDKLLSSIDGSFLLAGHSLGGWVSLAAAAASDRIEKLITVGCWSRYNKEMEEFCKKSIDEIERGNLEEIQKTMRRVAINQKDKKLSEIDDLVKSMQMSCSSKLFLNQARAMLHGMDISDRLEKIKAKTLIIHHQIPSVFPVDEAKYIADHVVGAKLEIIKDCGHMIPLEKPKILSKFMRDFILE